MISKEEVLHIAKLARLELLPEEVEKMQKDLTAILGYFDILKKAPRSDTNLRMASESTNNAMRKDLVVERPASLANKLVGAAPDRKDDYVKVKSIL